MSTGKWKDFYKERINSSYQDYFNQRYKIMIDLAENLSSKNIIMELGCGIGSISKSLKSRGFNSFGFDISEDMVDLANRNLGDSRFYQGDIFKTEFPEDILKITHGVLEHFSDQEIKSICNRCKNSLHYVPLDKYKTPSFGDERLLSYQHWIELVNPKAYVLFNDDHDLIFIL